MKKIFILLSSFFLQLSVYSQYTENFSVVTGANYINDDAAEYSKWAYSLKLTFPSDATQFNVGVLFSKRWLDSYQIEGISIGLDNAPFHFSDRFFFILGSDLFLQHHKIKLGSSYITNSIAVTPNFYIGLKSYVFNKLYFQCDAGFNLQFMYFYETLIWGSVNPGLLANFKLGFEF